MDYFSIVPNEITIMIFSYLKPRDTILVSRDWFSMSKFVFPHFKLYKNINKNAKIAEEILAVVKQKNLINDIYALYRKIDVFHKIKDYKNTISWEDCGKFVFLSIWNHTPCDEGHIKCRPYGNCYNGLIARFYIEDYEDKPRIVVECHDSCNDTEEDIHCEDVADIHADFDCYLYDTLDRNLYRYCSDIVELIYEYAKNKCSN